MSLTHVESQTTLKLKPHHLKNNLRYLLKSHNLEIKQLSELTGVAEPTIGRLARIENAKPNWFSLEPIANFFHISVDSLMKDNLEKIKIAQKKFYYVPVFQLNDLPLNKAKDPKILNLLPCDTVQHDNAFAVLVENDAMNPLIRKGTTIIVDPQLKPYDGAIVVLLDDKQHPLIRQVVDHGNKLFFRLVSLDKLEYFETFSIQGVVIKVIMDFNNETGSPTTV